MKTKASFLLFVLASLTMVGCGANGSTTSSEPFSSSNEAASAITSQSYGYINPDESQETPEVIWDISDKSSSVTAELYKDSEKEGYFTLLISGNGAMKSFSSYAAPWTSLYRTKITAVEIADGVTNISYGAFYRCSSLAKVKIGNSVTSIGDMAFSLCDHMTEISFGNSVTDIGYQAFFCCSGLNSLVLPDSVKNIGRDAFVYCNNLTSITLGKGISSVGSMAFAGCYKLIEIINFSQLNISVGSSENGYLAYYALNIKTSGSSDIVLDNGYYFYKYKEANYLLGYQSKESTLSLPVSYQGEKYEIYDYAFYDCGSLVSLTIPGGVTKIGYSSFAYCTSIKEMEIPSSVTSIGKSAFANCGSLVSISLPDSVNYIGSEAFCGCNHLTSISIPTSVTSIEEDAFAFCSSLTTLTIPDSVTTIHDYAFYLCSGLTSITISKSVKTIGGWVFWSCPKLATVNYEGTVSEWDAINKKSFWYKDILATGVTCSDGTAKLYK